MLQHQTPARSAGTNSRRPCWTSTRKLKEKLGPLEKRLEQVRDRLQDLVTEHGHSVDELRGVMVQVEPRFRKEYDAERLLVAFPRLSACVKPAVDVAQLGACPRAGVLTETELEREAVLTRALYSHALIVKPLGHRPLRAGLAKR